MIFIQVKFDSFIFFLFFWTFFLKKKLFEINLDVALASISKLKNKGIGHILYKESYTQDFEVIFVVFDKKLKK